MEAVSQALAYFFTLNDKGLQNNFSQFCGMAQFLQNAAGHVPMGESRTRAREYAILRHSAISFLQTVENAMKHALCLSLFLGLSVAALADTYADWKTAQGPQDASRSFLSSSNGAVEVHVADVGSGQTGRFTIGTGAGQYLLYGHGSDPWSTYVRIRVDGVVYAPEGGGNFDVAMLPFSGPAFNGASIVTSWDAGGVHLTQTVTPVMVGGQGTVRIEYDTYNGSNTAHDVSVMVEMDTMVNWNDAAPISTSNGYVNVETCYSGAQVPNTWQAFELAPDQGPGYLVGCGILNGNGATLPDFSAFGGWGWVYSGPFDYVCSGQPYGDSGCLLRWNAGYVPVGGGNHYQTFYGTCGVVNSPGNLSLTLGGTSTLSCENGEIEPNPFDVNLLVTNTGGDVCHDVTATISNGPGLVGVGAAQVVIGDIPAGGVGAASFFLSALAAYCNTYGSYTVEVTSADCPTNTISREIFIPCCNNVEAQEQPLAYGLGQNYPNPFNPVTSIDFTMSETGTARLTVYTLDGRSVATLWSGPAVRGTHTVSFDASSLPSGIYACTLTSTQGVQTRKMVLVK